jgi:hypothetical protein
MADGETPLIQSGQQYALAETRSTNPFGQLFDRCRVFFVDHASTAKDFGGLFPSLIGTFLALGLHPFLAGFCVISAAVQVFGILGEREKRDRLAQRDSEIAGLKEEKNRVEQELIDAQDCIEEYQAVFRSALEMILNGFYEWRELRGDVRITLYYHSISSNSFVVLARTCRQALYAGASPKRFPDNCGVLGKLIDSATYYEADILDGGSDAEYGTKQQLKYGIPANQANEYRMKSRCYFGARTALSDGFFGYLIFETVEPLMLQESYLKGKVEEHTKPLSALIQAFKPHIDQSISEEAINV